MILSVHSLRVVVSLTNSEGPSTQCLETPVPKAIPLMAVATSVLQNWVIGPFENILVAVVGLFLLFQVTGYLDPRRSRPACPTHTTQRVQVPNIQGL